MIFEKYTFKQKFIALMAIFVMLSYTAYKRSFSQLIRVFIENKELTQKAQLINNTSLDAGALHNEIESIDRIIGKENINKETIQQNIVSFVTHHEANISIYNLDPIHEYTEENYKIYTHILDVTGQFNPLLSLAYDFEKKFKESRLVGFNFYTIRKNNQGDTLHLKLIFQNYETIK